MKELLIIVSLLLCSVVAEPPAPYPPSGWRPDGPSFELPARIPAQNPQKQEYLPPVDPRRPETPTEFDSGVDVSVQGLPVREQQPIFQLSPINGQQYAGPNYQADIRSLDQTLQQIQYLQQLIKQREFDRQRQFDAAQGNAANGLPNPQPPRRFVPQTTSTTTTTTTTQKPEFKTDTSTDSTLDLNEGEDYDDGKETDSSAQKQKVSVEVTKQNIQEYPPELFLAPLTQFKVQPQFVQLQQLGQLRAPILYQPIQQDVDSQKSEGFNGPAHFAALPSVLAQQQLLTAQAQPAPQPQPAFTQNPAFLIARGQETPTPTYLAPAPQESINQYQPAITNQYQPLAQPQVQAFPQFQAQPVVLPPQTTNQLQPNQYAQTQPQTETEEVEKVSDEDLSEAQQPQQPQFVYQPSYQPQEFYQQQFPAQQYPVQPQLEAAGQYQPQAVGQYQPQAAGQYQPQAVGQYQPQAAGQYQPQAAGQYQHQDQQAQYAPQPQLINYPAQDWNQYYQNQLYQQQFADPNQVPQQIYQGQDALQSGLNVNQQGNGIEQKEETEDEPEEQNDDTQATAVATAFGARTQPRVLPQYGVPAPRPQANPGYPTTTDAPQEEASDDGPAIAQATAVATGSKKSAKLRSRRVRPIFTLDRSGHLVLAQEQ